MQKKKVDALISQRKMRRACYGKIGKVRFCFDSDEERILYKFLCGDKLRIKEWKKCKGKDIPYSYNQWKDRIFNKYSICSKRQLEEFERYLKVGRRNCNVWNKSTDIVQPAIASVILAFVVNSLSEKPNSIVSIVLAIPLVVYFTMSSVYGSTKDDIIEQKLYEDYIEIIHSMIEQKNDE